MTNNTNKHTLPIWTEVEYTALCKNPYLSTPFFIPKESKVFLCKEDGSREEQRMIFPGLQVYCCRRRGRMGRRPNTWRNVGKTSGR